MTEDTRILLANIAGAMTDLQDDEAWAWFVALYGPEDEALRALNSLRAKATLAISKAQAGET